MKSRINNERTSQDVINRLPNLRTFGNALKRLVQDKLSEHKQYIDKYGEDLPEIRNWKWNVIHASKTNK